MPALRANAAPTDLRCWSVFQPNASRGGELRSVAALQERQLIKARGWYLAERVVIAVGRHEVVVWPSLAGRVLGPPVGRWAPHDLLAFPVEPPTSLPPWWIAFLLVDLPRSRIIAELRAVRDDAQSEATFRQLAAEP